MQAKGMDGSQQGSGDPALRAQVAQLQSREAALLKQLDEAQAHIHQLEEKLAEVCICQAVGVVVNVYVQGVRHVACLPVSTSMVGAGVVGLVLGGGYLMFHEC